MRSGPAVESSGTVEPDLLQQRRALLAERWVARLPFDAIRERVECVVPEAVLGVDVRHTGRAGLAQRSLELRARRDGSDRRGS